MHKITRAETRPEPAGLVIHGAAKYDFIVWLFTLGGEKRMRQRMLRLALLKPGEHVLDMGCGTGTLAILAKRQVGEHGVVYGVDASPEMVARAREKAKGAGLDVVFKQGAVQALPFPDVSLDVVISTLMLHHVPKKARGQVAHEIKRVLKPDGRFLAVDFMKPAMRDRSVWSRFHRHGAIDLTEFANELEAAGLHVTADGAIGEKNMHYVLAASGSPDSLQLADRAARGHAHARPGAHGLIAVLLLLLAGALIALHLVGAAQLSSLLSQSGGRFWYWLAGALALIVFVKAGFVRLAHHLAGGPLTRWLNAREQERD